MLGTVHIIFPLTSDEKVKEFYKGIQEQTKFFLDEGYHPSEIEYHYQQSDSIISCLMIAKRDK